MYGFAVGISAQAVSRWECGGAPDIALLPAIARALTHDRSILLVDEGTSALDRKNADIVEKSLLCNPSLTLILVSHHLTPERKRQFTKVYDLQPATSCQT